MTDNHDPKETFEEFKDSFSYGSRPDLNFKFMKSFSESDGATFLQTLLWKISDAINADDLSTLREHVIQGQTDAYMSGNPKWTYDDGYFAPLQKPIAESRVALLTSSGHFVKGDDPQPFGHADLSQAESIDMIDEFLKTPPTLSEIPVDTPSENITVRHPGYDIRGAQLDHNVNLPIQPLQRLADEGIIGDLHHTAYTFVGACSQLRLRSKIAPQWAQMFKYNQIDLAILVPV